MNRLNNYKMFVESLNEDYEEIMKNMGDDVDVANYEGAESEISSLKDNVEKKKTELEDGLNNLEKLEVDTFTDENKESVDKKKVEIKEKIEKLKGEITSFEDNIKILNDKVSSIKSE